MMTGAKPSVGSSSSKSRAPVRRIRPMASICCSPPESFVPWLDRRSLRLGNSRKIEAAGADTGGQQQVFFDAEARENAALLGTQRDAQPSDPVAGQADELLALVANRSGALADDAHDRFQRRRLAGAIAAQQRHHLAGQNLEA